MSKRNYCPVCEQHSKFKPSGNGRRPRAKCRHCGAKERHRLAWCFLSRKTDWLESKALTSVLHVAPEKALKPRIGTTLGEGYLSFDLNMPDARVRGDLMCTPFRANQFDGILCSHVLEHVADDRIALAELARILHPRGHALIMVPISASKTFEDPSVTDPRERLDLFGREDHVRRYGPDFAERLAAAGFDFELFKPDDFLSSADIIDMAIKPKESVFWCRKGRN